MKAAPISRRASLLVGPLLAVLPGCSVLPSPQAARIYRLLPQVDDPPGPPVRQARLTIDLPVTSGSLDTDRIALTQGRTRFDYYADSVWTDRVPVLLQTLMVEAFEADGRIPAVGRENYELTHGYVLRTEIRRFEAQYAAAPATDAVPPEIAVTLALQLSVGPDGRLVGKKLISSSAPATRDRLDRIVMAFDAAMGEALSQSVGWTVRAISADQARGRHR